MSSPGPSLVLILQVFSSLVVNLTYPTLILQLSCIFHLQERHALCPQYRAILNIADGVTLLPRAASSVVEGGTRETASCGHQTRAPGRNTSTVWMLREMNTAPGHQAAVPTGHTSWEVTLPGGIQCKEVNRIEVHSCSERRV